MQPLISRNEPVEFRFKEQGAEYLVRFQDKPGSIYGVTVWKGGKAIDYREQFWGSRYRDNAKYILEQTLFELKTKDMNNITGGGKDTFDIDKQAAVIALSNEMFAGSRQMTDFETKCLNESFKSGLKRTPTRPNRR